MALTQQANIRNSIATQLLKVVFCLYLVIVVFISAGHMITEYHYQKRNIILDLQGIEQTFKNPLAIEIWQMDHEGMQSSVEGMLKMPAVVGVKIHNGSEKPIAIAGMVSQDGRVGNIGMHVNLLGLDGQETVIDEKKISRARLIEHQFPILYNYQGQVKELGTASIYSSSAIILERVKLGYIMLLVNAVLKIIALWFIFLWVSNYLLRRPLTDLAAATESIDLDNLEDANIDIGVDGHTELKVLEESFNSMLSNLKSSLEERNKSEEELRRVTDNLFESFIYRFDTNDVFNYVSSSITKVLGYLPEEFLVKTSEYITDNPVNEDVLRKSEQSLKGIQQEPFEIEVYHKDGSIRWLEVSESPVFDKSGRVAAVEGIAHDITHRKKTEAEREQLLNTLEFKNKELQDIVYTASHDLKSPLVNIMGFSCELENVCGELQQIIEQHHEQEKSDQLKTILNDNIPEALGYITTSVSKMSKLLKGLLQVSRVGTAQIEIEKLDMQKIANDVLVATGHLLKENNIEINLAQLPNCKGDANMVDSVFANLIGNAIKYRDASKQSHINITGKIEGSRSIYCVEDNGIGIAGEHQHKAFEIFHRLNPEGSIDGEGLGLTIVTRILDRLGGRIWLESEPGMGSKFFFALPNA